MTPHGVARVADVKQGDSVLTLDAHGNSMYTKVKDNTYIPGPFSFHSIMFNDTGRILSVTENHPMFANQSSSPETVHKLAAQDVKPGDIIRMQSMDSAVVSYVGVSTRLGKWTLATESCTVVANGVFTGTLCEDADQWLNITSPQLNPIDTMGKMGVEGTN